MYDFRLIDVRALFVVRRSLNSLADGHAALFLGCKGCIRSDAIRWPSLQFVDCSMVRLAGKTSFWLVRSRVHGDVSMAVILCLYLCLVVTVLFQYWFGM